MASYWVRPATDRDLSAVRALARRVRREGSRRGPAGDAPGVSGSDGVWVVEAGRGEIVGCCAVREEGCGNWRLLVLYLAPDWRGFGLGRSLMAAAVRHVQESGGLALSAELPEEGSEAGAMIRRLGFTPGGSTGSGAGALTLALGRPS